VLEAKMSGLPSVVLPSGDLPDLVSHKNDGWVCATVDAEALAEGLSYFLNCPGELARAGRAARVSADQYSEERFAAAWNEVFATDPKENAHAC